jgi:teichuronic acid biosynthesis glycosyltransferase TuaC
MKVLWILPGDPNSKVNMVFAKRTLPSVSALGVEVEVFHLTSRSNPIALFRLWLQARSVVARFNPQLVHAHYGSLTGLFACLLGRPKIITFRGSDVNGDPDLPWYRGIISGVATQLAAGLASGSIYVSEQLRRRLMFPGRETICLPSPIDLDHFKPISKTECRSALSLPIEDKIVSFVTSSGRDMKRPALAKAVVDNLKKKGHKTRFLEIKNVDPIDVPKWLCASDCMIFTSSREGSPNAVREALACGVPVVSVAVGDVGRWIPMDPYSAISQSDSVLALSDLVERAWTSPEPRKRSVDFSGLTPVSHARVLVDFYQKVIKV